MLSLFYRQDLRDKEIEAKKAAGDLSSVTRPLDGDRGVCVVHYPSLVMDGVFNFCGTRFYFIIFFSFTDG
jgi:hypothetical protein